MAYISKSIVSDASATITFSYQAAVDDYLFLLDCGQYNTITSPPSGGATWSTLSYTKAGTGAFTNEIYHKRAGASEPTTITITRSSGNHSAQLIVIKGMHTTTAPIVQSRASAGTTFPNSPSITPNQAKDLILYFNFAHNIQMVADNGVIKIQRNGGNYGFINTYFTYAKTSSSVPSLNYYVGPNTSVNPTMVTLSLLDNGSGNYSGFVDYANPPATIIAPLNNGANGHLTSNSDIDLTSVITTLDGKSTTNRTAVNPDRNFEVLFNPWAYFVAAVSADCYIRGASITPSVNLENDILVITTGARSSTYNTYDSMGKWFGIGDGTNFRLWKIDALDTIPSGSEVDIPVIFEVSGGFEAQEYGTVTSTVLQGITHFAFAGHGRGTYTSNHVGFLHRLNTMIVLGGSSSFPADLNTGVNAGRTNSLRTVSSQSRQSQTQFYVLQSVQVGDGSVSTYWDSSRHSIEFPSASSVSNLKIQAQISINKLFFTIKASASDTVKFESTVFNMGNFHTFRIDSTTSSSATYSEVGAIVLSATLDVNDIGRAFSSMSFIGCKELLYTNIPNLSGGGILLSGCVDAQAIKISGATQAALQSDLDKLANCDFTNNSVALRIEFTGTGAVSLNMSGTTFSGNTTDIHYNSTNSSALTIVLSNGANPTTSAISGSATGVTFSNDKTFTIICQDDTGATLTGAEVTILQTGTQTEDFHVETSATGTEVYTFTAPLGHNVDVQVFKPGYERYWEENKDLGSANSSLTVQLRTVPSYEA